MRESRPGVAARGIRRSLETLAALGLAACGSQSPGAPDASLIQVTERTSCEAVNPSFCAGLYGFTVMSDGHYVVGPTDDGVQGGGSISEGELVQLSADAMRVVGGLGGSLQCDSVGSLKALMVEYYPRPFPQ